MKIDLELYRKDMRVSLNPRVSLSIIDISPEQPRHTLVFLHGFGGQATQWIYQLHNFSDENRGIAIDQRGHGHSQKPKGHYNLSTLTTDVEAILDGLGINEKIVLIGHSFGCAIATEFAFHHPNRVDRLVLIAASGEYRLNPIYKSLLRLPHSALTALTPFTRKWLGAPPPVLKSWYQDALSKWVGWDLFSKLTIPTIVIRGHQDRVFEKPLFEEVARTIPGAEDIDVGSSGHMVMLERREAVNRAISRFIYPHSGSWRESYISLDEKESSSLIIERPWLPHYQEGTPYTIAVPSVPLQDILTSSARRFSRRIAVRFEGSRISYSHLFREVNRFSNTLSRLGIKKGDRVMLLLPNLPQMVIAFFGTLKIGAVAVFTLPTNNTAELTHQINHCGAKALITLTQFDELIYDIKNQLEPTGSSPLEHIIFTHIGDYLPWHKRLIFRFSSEKRKMHLLDIPMDANMHIYRQVLHTKDEKPPDIQISASDLAAIIYTGGTTSRPKGVMLTHRNLVANALQTRHWMPDAEEGRERFLCVLPFSHSYGLTAALNVPIALGATLILKPKFDVNDVLDTIKRYRPTIFPGAPRIYVAIKDFPGVRKYGVESIKSCISGSDPLPIEVQESFEKLTRGRLVEGYGLTEASPVTHANPLHGTRKTGSIGIPLPSTEARIMDLRRGRDPVPVGQIGELSVRGPQVMAGYWQNSDETNKVLSKDGWLLTGDVAQMDSDGFFRIVARKADMWYPSKPSEPAFPRDIEEVLFEVPQVKEVAVVAIASQPIAFVITRGDNPSASALIAYCKRRLPPELVPRMIIFVEEFPRTFIGKVIRRELAKHFEESAVS